MITFCEILDQHDKSTITDTVLRSLPNWFGIEASILSYVHNVKELTFIAALNDEISIGFAAIKKHNQYTAEIYVMGVLKEYHGRGVGKTLVRLCEETCVRNNMRFLSVKTLDESRSDNFYERTRRFYLAMGFLPLEVFDTLWGEENPCLLMVKSV